MLHGNTNNRQNPFVFTDQYGVGRRPINYPGGNGAAAAAGHPGCARDSLTRHAEQAAAAPV